MAVEVSAAVEMASVAEATAWAAVDSAWEAAATVSAAAEMALVAEARGADLSPRRGQPAAGAARGETQQASAPVDMRA